MTDPKPTLDTPAIIEYQPSAHRDKCLELIRINTPKYFVNDEEKNFTNYLDHETDLYYVVLIEKEVAACGGINFSQTDKTAGVLSWDIVHPNFQGKGLGKALTEHRISVLKQTNGIKKVIVRTSQFTDGFYGKMGFNLLDIKKDYWASGIDMHFMELVF